MNLSDAMVNEIKRVIPREIKLKPKEAEQITTDLDNVSITPSSDSLINTLSEKQREKLELVLEIKARFVQNISIRQMAKEYNLSRVTIKKYIEMSNPQVEVKYDNSRERYSYLDPYKDEIKRLCITLTVQELKAKLEEKYHQKISYSNLTSYIRRHHFKPEKSQRDILDGPPTPSYFKIFRSKLIKYIFDWKLKNDDLETIEANLETLVESYDLIDNFKQFFATFKSTLIKRDWNNLSSIINSIYDCKIINKFIKGLKSDYEAVINAAKFAYSNGCVEGNVNKLKKIKRDMYGRAHINLLRNKVIYQSLYF